MDDLTVRRRTLWSSTVRSFQLSVSIYCVYCDIHTVVYPIPSAVFLGILYPPNVLRCVQKSQRMFIKNVRRVKGIREK
jgi:hypothetical protein